MSSCLDSNVLIALWDLHSGMSAIVSQAFQRYRQSGPIYICGPVFGELLGFPQRTVEEIRSFLADEEIQIDWNFTEDDWQSAGLAYQGYVVRRRSSGSGLSRRMLTDFLIGAHVNTRKHTLVTLDNRLYKAAFPGLRIETI